MLLSSGCGSVTRLFACLRFWENQLKILSLPFLSLALGYSTVLLWVLRLSAIFKRLFTDVLSVSMRPWAANRESKGSGSVV